MGWQLYRIRGVAEKVMGGGWALVDADGRLIACNDLISDNESARALGVLRPGEVFEDQSNFNQQEDN